MTWISATPGHTPNELILSLLKLIGPDEQLGISGVVTAERRPAHDDVIVDSASVAHFTIRGRDIFVGVEIIHATMDIRAAVLPDIRISIYDPTTREEGTVSPL